jgi:hypothetical protein
MENRRTPTKEDRRASENYCRIISSTSEKLFQCLPQFVPMCHGMAFDFAHRLELLCPDLVNSSPRIAGTSGARIAHTGGRRCRSKGTIGAIWWNSETFAWRIWPGDIPKTLQWRPTTDIDVADIDDEICSHALIDRSNGSRVRVISVSARWPAAAVRRCLRQG